ncbi:uncharacterized protein [Nicotiana sylvestris]|uniref:uncharacterized protein n=1 Tax=Nicotiana sylvestris TaxID=4096 RepID=UPI00388C63CB
MAPPDWLAGRRRKMMPYLFRDHLGSFGHGCKARNAGEQGSTAKPNSFRLSPKVYDYRKSNHLCFRGGEKYAPGHQFKKKQLNSMKGEVEPIPECTDAVEEQPCADLIIEGELEQEVMEALCMNALSCDNRGVNTILVKGTIRNSKLMLIDSGSTNSFIDANTVKETGYQARHCPLVRVTVADGNYVMYTSICTGYQWKMQGRPFQEDLLIIPLGGYDMVMGNDWMKKHNPTKFDHEKMCYHWKERNKLVLQGVSEKGKLNMISTGTMGNMLNKDQALIAHLFMMSSLVAEDQEPIEQAIQEVLHLYPDVFVEPKSLPPVRTLDHTISLKPRAMPVSLRPYRYNYYQKDELERQVDLRASYHHIRMKVDDVYKIAFRTPLCHYEFRVIPFELTNAPATFQALMNQVFQPFPRIDAFKWNIEADLAFAALKKDMCSTPVFSLPDYTQNGIGAILMQGRRPVTYFSKVLAQKHREIAHSYEGDTQAAELFGQISVNIQGPNIWNYSSSLLRRKGKIYIGANSGLRIQLISTFHDSHIGGH